MLDSIMSINSIYPPKPRGRPKKDTQKPTTTATKRKAISKTKGPWYIETDSSSPEQEVIGIGDKTRKLRSASKKQGSRNTRTSGRGGKRARVVESDSEEPEAENDDQEADSPLPLVSKTPPNGTPTNDKESTTKKAAQAQPQRPPAEIVKSTSPPAAVDSMASTFPPTHAFDIPLFKFQQTATHQFFQPLTYNLTTNTSRTPDLPALRVCLAMMADQLKRSFHLNDLRGLPQDVSDRIRGLHANLMGLQGRVGLYMRGGMPQSSGKEMIEILDGCAQQHQQQQMGLPNMNAAALQRSQQLDLGHQLPVVRPQPAIETQQQFVPPTSYCTLMQAQSQLVYQQKPAQAQAQAMGSQQVRSQQQQQTQTGRTMWGFGSILPRIQNGNDIPQSQFNKNMTPAQAQAIYEQQIRPQRQAQAKPATTNTGNTNPQLQNMTALHPSQNGNLKPPTQQSTGRQTGLSISYEQYSMMQQRDALAQQPYKAFDSLGQNTNIVNQGYQLNSLTTAQTGEIKQQAQFQQAQFHQAQAAYQQYTRIQQQQSQSTPVTWTPMNAPSQLKNGSVFLSAKSCDTSDQRLQNTTLQQSQQAKQQRNVQPNPTQVWPPPQSMINPTLAATRPLTGTTFQTGIQWSAQASAATEHAQCLPAKKAYQDHLQQIEQQKEQKAGSLRKNELVEGGSDGKWEFEAAISTEKK